MKTLFSLVLGVLVLSGCASEIKDLKSPCVGAEGSPCERRPVNQGLS